jgi:hypothetical protein
MDKNTDLVVGKSKGKHFILHSEDNDFKENTIYTLMDTINKSSESSFSGGKL